MDGFYVSIIFIGILLIIFSLVWTALDKKKTMDHSQKMAEKKDELIEIINDADQMVVELNRYSDYIVSQITNKQDEISQALKNVEEKLIELEARTNIAAGRSIEPGKKVLQAYKEQSSSTNNQTKQSKSKTKQIEGTEVKDRVIPLNHRYNNVLRLARQGFDETEIAKRLGLGKGEIQLILGVSGVAEIVPEVGIKA